jgi:hypothetical protein
MAFSSSSILMGGDSRYLSLVASGSLTQAAFGGESAGGDGRPEFEVCHNTPSGLIPLVAVQPLGSAGGLTVSKPSKIWHEMGVGVGLLVGAGVGVVA